MNNKKTLVAHCFSSAVEAMRQFLIRSHSVDIIETLDSEKCWEDFEDEEKYPDAYTVLSR